MTNTTTPKSGIVKVIQISDTHLFANDALEIYGTKSNITFKEVMYKLVNEDIHDTNIIFLTGDISQDETFESYQKIANDLSKLNIPIYWIPGNHDDLEKVEHEFKQANNFHRQSTLTLSHWHFIFLNTKIEGRDDGYLSKLELDLLKNKIIAAPNNKQIAIVMHHHPAPVGTPLIDHYILQNRQDFWDIVTRTNVKLIICGHVHGDYSFQYNNIMIESSPATCLQFEKGTTQLKISNKIGYKIYYFDKNSYNSKTKLW